MLKIEAQFMGGNMLEIVAYAALPVYLLMLLAICAFCGERRTIVVSRKKGEDPDDSGELFNDLTDPARSYLAYNLHHDDSMSDDSSSGWDDATPMGDDMTSGFDD